MITIGKDILTLMLMKFRQQKLLEKQTHLYRVQFHLHNRSDSAEQKYQQDYEICNHVVIFGLTLRNMKSKY